MTDEQDEAVYWCPRCDRIYATVEEFNAHIEREKEFHGDMPSFETDD